MASQFKQLIYKAIVNLERKFWQGVTIVDTEGDPVETSNGALDTVPKIIDEYGIINRQIGDNIFRGAVISIASEHHEIHCGDSYECSFIGDLGNGDVNHILITTPDWGVIDPTNAGSDQSIKIAHFKFAVSVESESTVDFFQSPTVTNVGNSQVVSNRNFNSENVDFLTISNDATVSATGVRKDIHKIGSGRGVGGVAGRADEFILKNNTTYLLRITNNTTTNNWYDVNLDYYVHPGI